MVFRVNIAILFLLFSVSVVGQRTVVLRGTLTDGETGLPVENATVDGGGSFRLSTDRYGKFVFHMPGGKCRLVIRHLSYGEDTVVLNLQRDTMIRIALTPVAHALGETTVAGRREKQALGGLAGGRFELDMQELRSLPKFIGNNDPLKILQLLPGVQTAGEGNSGIFVRGGEPGHNLILWNDAPIYNASHLLGAFSVFNTGHIGKFTLYKSHMPADFGGRLSSLIEVQSPDVIPEKIMVSGDIGMIASQATLAVPLGKKSAFYVSGRQTYVGLTLKPLIQGMASGKGKDKPFGYEFGDCNFTYVYRPDVRNKVVVNGYWGMDRLRVEDEDYQLDGKIRWWNLALSASWEHQWNEQVTSKNVLFYSQYNNRLNIIQNILSADLPSQIRDGGFRHKTRWSFGRLQLLAGGDYIYHVLEPQTPDVTTHVSGQGNSAMQIYHSHEIALYVNGRMNLTSRLSAEVGIRYGLNFQTGPFDDLSYDDRGVLIDSVHYSRGQILGFRQGWEPRVALQYTVGENQQLRLAYNRQQQWVNLVSISGVGLPTDFWVPASKNIPSQNSDNYSLGYFRTLFDGQFECSVEGYYRRLRHQMEYKNALFDLFNQQYVLEQSINYGKGDAYGAEFIFKKNRGRVNGWVSYTLGRSQRNFPGIMGNATFSAKHDRRHDFSLVANYRLNDKWDLSAVFVYATGSCFTMPTGMYMMGGNLVKEYGKYNGSRLPDYHRLDLSATYWFFKGKDRESGLNFSVYNVYKRSNPLYIFIVAKPGRYDESQVKIATKKKKLYDIIPSVSWTFRF